MTFDLDIKHDNHLTLNNLGLKVEVVGQSLCSPVHVYVTGNCVCRLAAVQGTFMF